MNTNQTDAEYWMTRCESLEAQRDVIIEERYKLQDERDALKARVAQLEEALRWYADENYRVVKYDCKDFGQRARAALATALDERNRQQANARR